MSDRAFTRIVRIAALAVAVVLGARLLWRIALPTGVLVVGSDLDGPAPYMTALKPNGRTDKTVIGDDGIARTAVRTDPVYLDLTPPYAFTAATVTLTYENPDGAPVDVAALASSLDGAFDRRVLERPLLDRLPWKRVSSGSLSLYSRHGGYASVDDFLRDPPPRASVAVAGVDGGFLAPYRIPGYEPSTERRDLIVSLRGAHELFTYAKDEDIDLVFLVQDMNRQDGADPVTVTVWNGDTDAQVARVLLPDDGNTADDQRSSPLRAIPVTVLAPAEGFYRVSFVAGDDVFIREIRTRQRKLSFKGGVYLGDHVGYSDRRAPVNLFASGRRIDAVTHHVEGLQRLEVGGASLVLAERHARVGRRLTAGTTRIVSPARDVVLDTDGVMAFSEEELFDPGPFDLPWFTSLDDLDVMGIDHVLVAYDPPRKDGPVREASTVFDLAALDRTEEGAYRLALSLPALAETRHSFALREVRIAFTRPRIPFMQALREFFSGPPKIERPDGRIDDAIHFREYVP